MTHRRLALAFAAALLVALTPAVALACPVCASGQEGSTAYFLAFVLLTTLPLVLLGALFLYLRQRARELASADDDARRRPPAPIPTEHAARV